MSAFNHQQSVRDRKSQQSIVMTTTRIIRKVCSTGITLTALHARLPALPASQPLHICPGGSPLGRPDRVLTARRAGPGLSQSPVPQTQFSKSIFAAWCRPEAILLSFPLCRTETAR